MPEVVGVRFKPAGKIYYFDVEDVYPQVGMQLLWRRPGD